MAAVKEIFLSPFFGIANPQVEVLPRIFVRKILACRNSPFCLVKNFFQINFYEARAACFEKFAFFPCGEKLCS